MPLTLKYSLVIKFNYIYTENWLIPLSLFFLFFFFFWIFAHTLIFFITWKSVKRQVEIGKIKTVITILLHFSEVHTFSVLCYPTAQHTRQKGMVAYQSCKTNAINCGMLIKVLYRFYAVCLPIHTIPDIRRLTNCSNSLICCIFTNYFILLTSGNLYYSLFV